METSAKSQYFIDGANVDVGASMFFLKIILALKIRGKILLFYVFYIAVRHLKTSDHGACLRQWLVSCALDSINHSRSWTGNFPKVGFRLQSAVIAKP